MKTLKKVVDVAFVKAEIKRLKKLGAGAELDTDGELLKNDVLRAISRGKLSAEEMAALAKEVLKVNKISG